MPVAVSKAFQKVKSIPIIGATRSVIYLFPRSLPSCALLPNGSLFEFNIKRWVYMNQRHDLIKKHQKDKLIKFFSIYAAILIVVSCFIFFAFVIFIEIKNDRLVVSQLEKLVRQVEHFIVKGGS